MEGDVKDDTTKVVTDDKGLSTADDKTSQSDEKTEAALKAQGELSSLLEDHGFDSVEDLVEAMEEGGQLKQGLGDLDLDELKEKGQELDRVHAYWAEQDAKKSTDEEDSDDKIARLEKEVHGIKSSKQDEEDRKRGIQENQTALDDFSNEVTSFIKKQEDYPEEYRPFTALLLGVNNPANAIDISDKIATRKVCKDGVKTVRDFEQVVIKRYIDGKIKIPTITKTDAPAPVTEKIAKNLKESKKIAGEALTKLFGGKSG